MSAFRDVIVKLSTRDRRAVLLLGIFLAAVVLWKFAWLPAQVYAERAQANYRASALAAAWWSRYRPSGDETQPLPTGSDTRPLSVIITDTSRERQLAITSISPGSSGQVRVNLAPAPYASVAPWLETLERRYGSTITALEMSKVSEGMVELRMTVEKK